jgi:hypothetical protein
MLLHYSHQTPNPLPAHPPPVHLPPQSTFSLIPRSAVFPEDQMPTKEKSKTDKKSSEHQEFQKKIVAQLSLVFESSEKEKALDKFFKSLKLDEISGLDSTILSDAIAEFRKNRNIELANISGEDRIFNPYNTSYEDWKQIPMKYSSKPITQV